MEGPSDPLERLMQAFDCSLCSETFRDAVCFPTTCGHYFCRECVIATLEGPGISKSECPVCHKPGWKNDLKVSYTVNNALVHAAGLRAEVQRGREAEARLRQRRGSGVQHAAAGAAAGPSRPGSADPGAAAGRRLSHGEAGSSAGKRKRRGRSVPEQQEASGACAADGRQEQQAMLQPPADGQQQQEGAGWRERQPQCLWGRKKTPPPPAAPQAQQQRQQQQPPLRPPTASAPAARGAAKSDVTAAAAAMGAAGQGAPLQSAAAAAGEVPESPVPVLYDSDWEEQARAAPMGPATPEAIAALEAEVALLQQAIQLCDELPCLGGSAQRLPQQAEAGAAEEGAGAAGAAGTAAHVQQQPQQQQPPESQRAPLNEGQDVVIVPDTEEGSLQPSPPKPASAAAADSPGPAAACTAAAGQAAPQQQHGAAGAESASQQAQQAQRRQQRQDEQQPPQQQDDRKRRLSELQAAQAQQRALREGLTQEMEDEEGHRMSGRKRRKGGSGRAAPGSSRLGRPGDSAAKASTGAGASAPAQVQPAVQPVQQAAQQQGQHGAAQEPGRLSKTAAGDGDAVEVMWQVEGQLVPYVGRVLDVLPEGKHRIEYLDGEVATQDLDEEQWRLLLQEEYDEAEAEYQWQQQQASSSGDEFQLSSGSEGMHSGSQVSGGIDGVSSPAVAALPAPAAEPVAASHACSPGAPVRSSTAGQAAAAAQSAVAVPSTAAAPPAAAAAAAAATAAPPQRPQAAAAAAARPKAAAAPPVADPYAFVSNTEAVASEEQLFQAAPQPAARPQALQQQQHVPRQRQPPKQQAKPSAARKRPLVPPPKFNQEPAQQAQQAQQLPQGSEQQMPEWLRQDPSSKSEQQHGWQQASEAAAQQFGRKNKEAGVSLEGQPTSGSGARDAADSRASARQHSVQPEQHPPQPQQPQPQQLVRRPRLHERPSMQQRRRRRIESEEEEEAAQQQAAAAAAAAAEEAGKAAVPPAATDGAGAGAMDIVPSTQDAAGALFSMLQEKPAVAAAEASGSIMAALPLQPTSRHNTAAGDGGFVPASQLPLAGGWEVEAAVEQQQRRHGPAAAGQRRTSGKALQDPGLFGLPPAARGSGRSKSALQDPGLFSQSSEGSGSQARAAAEPGAPAAGAAAAAPADSEPQGIGFADLFAGATPSQAVCPSSPEPEELLDGNEGQLAATTAAPAAAAAAAEGAAGTPGGSSRRCIAVSGLTNEIQQKLLTLRARLGGLTLEEQVSERTTHVLVPMDDRCCVKQRSMQYLLALAHGCWVVGHGWVDACLEAGHWLPERQYEARGLADMKGSLLVPAAARQRHAPGGGGSPGLFAGRRVFLTAPPAGSGGSRSNSTGSASKVALVAQMVAAEGGSLVRALGQGEGGGGRGAASPSPSPEGATLVVCLAQGPQEARLALKMGQKRYPGRLLHHQSWIFDSLCCGRCLDPADYVMTEQRPLPTGARLSLSQQPSQASASQV